MRLILLAVVLLAGCHREPASVEYEPNTTDVTLPSGDVVRAEVMTNPKDQIRGMMFRTEMKPGHGMLFFHMRNDFIPYWMYQTKVPLDIIWLNADKNVVELVANAPPCKTAASQCPSYGGHEASLYVLELAAGQAQKYGVRVGEHIRF